MTRRSVIRCIRCGLVYSFDRTHIAAAAEGFIAHHCDRVLVAEYWQDGEIDAVWTSDQPGRSGPADLVRQHADTADDGWTMPPVDGGWTYRWKEM